MKVSQSKWVEGLGWRTIYNKGDFEKADFILCFGGKNVLSKNSNFEQFRSQHPNAQIIYCTTSGEIADMEVLDDSIIATMIEFDKTKVRSISKNIKNFESSYTIGQSLVEDLLAPDLAHIFVVSDGQLVNGSELVKGMNALVGDNVQITGGLAGDGYDFQKTYVGLNSEPIEGEIVAIGFYGSNLQIGFGSKGGWDVFGPERVVTKSKNNVLYELDGQSALELYKKYLGEAAAELPGSALYYPLSIRLENKETSVVRTILSIDEEAQSMTFAGDIPEGCIAKLMKHNFNRLIDGAEEAAICTTKNTDQEQKPDLAILVSCVGRKIVLGQRIEEEVEVVREVLGNDTAITGFYSYGEIAPQCYLSNCQLHNQTMTITTFKEI